MHKLGLYIHWPYCISKCPYCDFNSHVLERYDLEEWLRAYINQIAYFNAFANAPGDPTSEIGSTYSFYGTLQHYINGNRVNVFFPNAQEWYEGVVNAVDQSDSTFEVHYNLDDKYCWHDITWKVKLL